MRITKTMMQSATTDRPVATPPAGIQRRLDTQMEIQRPSLAKPAELVKAAAPGAE